ncbi:AAA family ATPase [Candidatus Synechococcus calcipolaris G9]|uniref:AAA family ATPase n=1 Tax=Candidatus Synechococcus calcipolaris G9 TaxID=1497997 RepID=A0ABT6EZQ0_9SYNE|nr:ATP-binding protein [Candidatus Synechococcus calcipolaris]MDG2991052.1 AAA family ATPase [Candidatus Synechococcus calcipolaris G9]
MSTVSLESIAIHKFRGIRDLELKGLGQINLLVGINNSGKTSVLEALSIYCHPLDIRVWLSTARQREQEYRISRTPSLDALQWLFSHDFLLNSEKLKTGTISISGSGSFAVKQMKATYEEMEGMFVSEKRRRLAAGDDQLAESEDEQIGESEDLLELRKGIDLRVDLYTEQLSLFNSEEADIIEDYQLWEHEFFSRTGKREPSLLTSVVTPASHRSDIGQFRLLSEARFHNFKADVLDLLRQMDHNISDIEILLSPESISSRFNIYIQHERLGLAPVSTFGDGVRRLLHIALKLASVRGGIFLIDELESTIHTEALQNSFGWLVKWCKEMDVQLFATTHSLEAVDALLDVTEYESDLVLYRLEPKEMQTRVVRHDWDRLKRLREELGQEVRW